MKKTISFSVFNFLLVAFLFAQPEIQLVEFTSGLDNPVDIAHAGDGRMFVVEKEGFIRIVLNNGTLLPDPFLDITDRVNNSQSERGLLGLTFHPDYATNGYFYVNYTGSGGHTNISRFSVTGDPNTADPSSEKVLLNVNQPVWNHNGGCIKFGPDGYLYTGFGDGGSGGDPDNYGQTTDTFLGKMIRIDVDNGDPYAIPADNPFVNNADYFPEIWSLGLRNPWRFSFDRETHDLWIGDVGQNAWEEIDFQPANSTGGENYGWRCYEGFHAFNVFGCDPPDNYLEPVHEYSNSNSVGGSVTGGFVYRGVNFPGIQGYYFYADFLSGRIWGILPDGAGGWTNTEFMNWSNNEISSFGEDVNGELYLAAYGSGRIMRVEEVCFQDVPLEFMQEPGQGVTALIAPEGFSTYQWYLDGNLIVGATNSTYETMEDGEYWVIVTDANGCEFTSITGSVFIESVIDLPGLLDFSVTPNPFSDLLFITLELEQATTLQVQIVNTVGKILKDKKVNVRGKWTESFDLASLPKGVYFLKIENESGKIVQQIVKQ